MTVTSLYCHLKKLVFLYYEFTQYKNNLFNLKSEIGNYYYSLKAIVRFPFLGGPTGGSVPISRLLKLVGPLAAKESTSMSLSSASSRLLSSSSCSSSSSSSSSSSTG